MSHILTIENNEIIGAIGGCVDKLLCRKSERKCKILSDNYLGVKVGWILTKIHENEKLKILLIGRKWLI